MEHELKTWPEFFKASISGKKKFEVRKNDRNFQVGDELVLREWEPGSGYYTDRKAVFYVDYVLSGYNWGIRKDFIVMSVTPRDSAG